jgi:hypothetical protein
MIRLGVPALSVIAKSKGLCIESLVRFPGTVKGSHSLETFFEITQNHDFDGQTESLEFAKWITHIASRPGHIFCDVR